MLYTLLSKSKYVNSIVMPSFTYYKSVGPGRLRH